MITSHFDTNINDQPSPAKELGDYLRESRKSCGLTIAQLAEKVGRPREWLNRIELGYSEFGEQKPPAKSDIEALIKYLAGAIEMSPDKLHDLRNKSEASYRELTNRSLAKKRDSVGKITQAEVIIGEDQIYQSAIALINEQHSDAIIRNTGIWSLAPSYLKATDDWSVYRKSIGDFLSKYQNSMLKRVEFVGSVDHLKLAEESDKWLAGDRDLSQVHNAKVKYFVHNPLLLDVLIGQREAILAIPQSTAHAGPSMAILVRDKLFVEALRVWFDEVLWEYPVDNQSVDFTDFNKSFKKIMDLYGFNHKDS